jgi:hypothetical protein
MDNDLNLEISESSEPLPADVQNGGGRRKTFIALGSGLLVAGVVFGSAATVGFMAAQPGFNDSSNSVTVVSQDSKASKASEASFVEAERACQLFLVHSQDYMGAVYMNRSPIAGQFVFNYNDKLMNFVDSYGDDIPDLGVAASSFVSDTNLVKADFSEAWVREPNPPSNAEGVSATPAANETPEYATRYMTTLTEISRVNAVGFAAISDFCQAGGFLSVSQLEAYAAGVKTVQGEVGPLVGSSKPS